MKTIAKLTLVILALLIAQSINAQPLDTLKIKAEADSLKAVADSLRKAWQLDEALETYQTALTKYQQIGDKESEAKVLKGIGIVFSYQGNAQETLHYWEKELAIQRELGDRKGEGITLNNIGIVYLELSDYPKALEYYEKSLEIYREFGDRSGESKTLNNIGMVYSDLSDYPKALEYYQQSLEICREIGDRRGEGATLHNIGVVYEELLDYWKALEYYEKSLEICREIGDRRGEGYSLNNIGVVYKDLSDYLKALEYYQQSLEIIREIGDRWGEGGTLGNIGTLYTEEEKYAEAEECIIQALAIARELEAEDLIQSEYSTLGDCYAAQNLDSLAVENYAKSIETAESIRGKLEVEAQKSSYTAGISSEYSKMVLSLLKLDRNEEAYNYIERGRARSFLDLLASGEVEVGKSRHEEFLRDEEESQEEIEEMEEQLIAAAEDTTQLLALRGKLEEKRGFITTTIEEKKQYEPELASMVTVNSLTLPEVQELLDGKSTILEYFLTEEKTLIWLITKDEAEVFQVEVGGDSLKLLVQVFRNTIMHLGETEGLSNELYQILFKPVEEKVRTKKLIIIPHGILHYLPFQALQDGDRKYLIEKYQIRYLPSASVMRYLIPKRRVKGTKLLAFGNPATDRAGYPPIPFSEGEVNEIAGLYRDSNVLIGADATEDKFRNLAPDYDILHLACHGELNSAYPLFSGLLLAPGDEQDGELDVHELFTMDLNAYLVVLSACHTGLGHLTTGDELVGLSRAFIYAGTPSILSSLWMVEDESTAYLMKEFYNNLKKHDKAESLRKAQLKMKKKYKNIRSWASFVLVGDSE
ncbi:MAG: CHAT domain-containing protein [candidate division Zixibacteria bacterium]|nr:CHAT domain-containing protein [Candidatus Tariuqbacter arcticus]